MDGRLTIRHRDGSQEQRGLHIDELEAALVDIFGLAVEPAWRALLGAAGVSCGCRCRMPGRRRAPEPCRPTASPETTAAAANHLTPSTTQGLRNTLSRRA